VRQHGALGGGTLRPDTLCSFLNGYLQIRLPTAEAVAVTAAQGECVLANKLFRANQAFILNQDINSRVNECNSSWGNNGMECRTTATPQC
jgi:hypothetical protein